MAIRPGATGGGRALFLVSAWLGAVILLHREPPEPRSFRYEFEAPTGAAFGNVGAQQRGGGPPAPQMALSPDGLRLAYVLTIEGKASLWVRPLDELAGQQIPGTEDASFPFWSPDSRFVAFFAEGQLKKIDLLGGPPMPICDAPAGEGGTWNNADEIVFAPDATGGLSRVAAAGGAPVQVTTLDTSSGESSHRWPHFLPDGRHFLVRHDQ